MPFFITALMRFANKKTTRKNSTQQNMQKQNFHGRSQIYSFKSNVKMQSDKTLTPQI